MTIYNFELKQNLKSIIIWTLALIGVNAMFLSVYPYYRDQMAVIKPMFEGFPPQILEAFGINVENLFTALGFYSFVQMYVQLMAAIQGMIFGLSILGKEVRLKTADFLFTKPVTRTSIFIQKWAAILTLLLGSWLSYSLFNYVLIRSLEAGSVHGSLFILVQTSNLLISLFFAAMGMLLASILRKLKSVVSISISFVFAFFVLNMMQSILDEEWIRYFSPFQFFERSHLFIHQQYEWPLLGVWFLFTFGAFMGAYVILSRKDIHAV